MLGGVRRRKAAASAKCYGEPRKSDDDAAALHFPARDGQDQSWLR